MGRLAAWWNPMAAGATLALCTAAATLAQPAPALEIVEERRRLIAAKQATTLAASRALQLARDAAGERDAAVRAHRQQLAATARVVAAQAELTTALARVALANDLLARQRVSLAAGQTPATRLLAALGQLARRPAVASIAQPGSIDDLVHLRAVLGTTLPAVRRRTAGLRTELARTRRLRADRAAAAATLADGRRQLADREAALAAVEAGHRASAVVLGRDASTESDRALALGERARDIVDRIAIDDGRQVTLGELTTLPAPPVPTPGAGGAAGYRLPVAGRLLTGFGEMSSSGVRSRGLTLIVRAGAIVRAPAGGRIAYAQPFRDYGPVVIIDHGSGWTSLVIGLHRLAVRPGTGVAVGSPLGRAGDGEEPVITVELRRRGQAIDPTALL